MQVAITRTICPRCDEPLRQDYDSLACIQCGYRGEGVMPEMNGFAQHGAPGPQEELKVFRKKIEIYLCQPFFMVTPEAHIKRYQFWIAYTVLSETAQQKYKLVALYKEDGFPWPHELNPRRMKRSPGGYLVTGGRETQELSVQYKEVLKFSIMRALNCEADDIRAFETTLHTHLNGQPLTEVMEVEGNRAHNNFRRKPGRPRSV